MKQLLWVILLGFVFLSHATDKVLVFSKTDGFRHKSIEVGAEAIKKLGNENNFEVFHTENANLFTYNNLKQYKVVVFLNTTKNVLNEKQEAAFKKYINKGGSFLGVHAATDTEYNWPWYNKLVGAYFLSHPNQCEATMHIQDNKHASTRHLNKTWIKHDEWYNFKNISEKINVVLTVDEATYKGGENGKFHPVAWYQEFDGGRMFYTALGHTKESYTNPDFLKHLLGGFFYCLNRK